MKAVNARTVNLTQRRLLSPTFAFSRELVNGRIRGLESNYKWLAASISVASFKPEEFKVTDAMFKAFRDFVVADSAFKVTPAMIDRNRSFNRARTAIQPCDGSLRPCNRRQSVHHSR